MPWKIENDVIAQDEHGNPIWVHEDGKEAAWNVPAQLASIKQLSESKKQLKEERDRLNQEIGKFRETFGDMLEKPDEIKTALKIKADVDAGKMFDSGKKNEAIQKALADATKEYEARMKAIETQFSDAQTKLKQKEDTIFNLTVNQAIGQSEFLNGKTTMPPDVASMLFSRNFKLEEIDGTLKPVPYKDGEKMFSLNPERAGKPADMEEALERLFKEYPHKDRFLRDYPGGPTATGGHGGRGAKDIVLRGKDALDPIKYRAAKAEAAKIGGKVILEQ